MSVPTDPIPQLPSNEVLLLKWAIFVAMGGTLTPPYNVDPLPQLPSNEVLLLKYLISAIASGGGGGGTGDVVGPASNVANGVALFDGVTGKLLTSDADLTFSGDTLTATKVSTSLLTITDVAGVSSMVAGGTSFNFDLAGSLFNYNYSIGNGWILRGASNGSTQLKISTNNGVNVAGIEPIGTGSLKITDGGAGTGKLTFNLATAAVTGLGAGAVAALTNATLTLTDSTGQVYRIPAII